MLQGLGCPDGGRLVWPIPPLLAALPRIWTPLSLLQALRDGRPLVGLRLVPEPRKGWPQQRPLYPFPQMLPTSREAVKRKISSRRSSHLMFPQPSNLSLPVVLPLSLLWTLREALIRRPRDSLTQVHRAWPHPHAEEEGAMVAVSRHLQMQRPSAPHLDGGLPPPVFPTPREWAPLRTCRPQRQPHTYHCPPRARHAPSPALQPPPPWPPRPVEAGSSYRWLGGNGSELPVLESAPQLHLRAVAEGSVVAAVVEGKAPRLLEARCGASHRPTQPTSPLGASLGLHRSRKLPSWEIG